MPARVKVPESVPERFVDMRLEMVPPEVAPLMERWRRLERDSEASSAKLACVKATVTLSKVVLSTSAREVPDVSVRIAVAESPS